MDGLLPSPSLSVLEFLEFGLPLISSSKVLAPAKFFSNLDPAIMGTDLLRGMVVPSDETVVALAEVCKSAVKSGAKSVLSLHIQSAPDKRLPLWVIPYWTEVSSLRKTWRTPWIVAEDYLSTRQQRWKGKNATASHRIIDEVYDALSTLPWAGKLKGFSNDDPIYTLSTYATHHWLSDAHEDQMLDLLRTEIKFDSTRRSVIIENLEFSNMLDKAYDERGTNYETSRRFEHLRQLGISLGSGTYKQLAYLMNVNNNHWVAAVLDFDESRILYGDSLGSKPRDRLRAVLSWWTHLHTGRDFAWEKLDITIQQDGFSCGLLSWNALVHWVFPNKHPLIKAEDVDNGRLQVLLRVIQRHQDRVSLLTISS